MPPPGAEAVAESVRLGTRLARVARYKPSQGDPRAYRSNDKDALVQDRALWRDYCLVIVRSPLAASSRVEGLLNIIRGYFLDRTEALRTRFAALGLEALVPCIEQQYVDLGGLLQDQQTRVQSALFGSEDDRATTSNTEWMEFLSPFFNGVLGAGAATTAPARASAAIALAAAAVLAAAPSPPPPPPPAAYPAPLYARPPRPTKHRRPTHRRRRRRRDPRRNPLPPGRRRRSARHPPGPGPRRPSPPEPCPRSCPARRRSSARA